jgi:hypothetical protein
MKALVHSTRRQRSEAVEAHQNHLTRHARRKTESLAGGSELHLLFPLDQARLVFPLTKHGWFSQASKVYPRSRPVVATLVLGSLSVWSILPPACRHLQQSLQAWFFQMDFPATDRVVLRNRVFNKEDSARKRGTVQVRALFRGECYSRACYCSQVYSQHPPRRPRPAAHRSQPA